VHGEKDPGGVMQRLRLESQQRTVYEKSSGLFAVEFADDAQATAGQGPANQLKRLMEAFRNGVGVASSKDIHIGLHFRAAISYLHVTLPSRDRKERLNPLLSRLYRTPFLFGPGQHSLSPLELLAQDRQAEKN